MRYRYIDRIDPSIPHPVDFSTKCLVFKDGDTTVIVKVPLESLNEASDNNQTE